MRMTVNGRNLSANGINANKKLKVRAQKGANG